MTIEPVIFGKYVACLLYICIWTRNSLGVPC